MHEYISHRVIVVDASEAFVRSVENELTARLPAEYPVVGYTKSDQALDALARYPQQVPLVVVADTAARVPSVHQGIFARVNETVPNSRGILFSANVSSEEMQQLVQAQLLYDLVRRTDDQSMSVLVAAVEKAFSRYQASLEYHLLTCFCERMATTPSPEASTVAAVDDRYAPQTMMVEMARGTARGRRYLRNMLPVNLISQ